MNDTQEKRRRVLRLKHFDYSQAASYFVTICTHERKPILGSVIDGRVIPTAAGEAVVAAWLGLPDRFPSVVLHEFAVMPNHLHGILTITQPIRWKRAGAASSAPTETTGEGPKQMGAASSGAAQIKEVTRESSDQLLNAGSGAGVSLGKILRAFKSLSGIEVNRILGRPDRPVWQRNYFEHIVPGEDDFRKTQKYVHENALRWEDDPENF
jgi:REP element-mobilizing transposase RayT